eukprot:9502536-Pyramimonas_sp.AAC.1
MRPIGPSSNPPGVGLVVAATRNRVMTNGLAGVDVSHSAVVEIRDNRIGAHTSLCNATQHGGKRYREGYCKWTTQANATVTGRIAPALEIVN